MKYEVVGSGDFHKEFETMGFPKVEVVQQMSSAGDWDFIVSKTGNKWFLASRENRFPRGGFNYYVSKDDLFKGNAEEVLTQVGEMIDSISHCSVDFNII